MRTPLVIHGATGIGNDQLQELAKRRVAKVNIGTAYRMAFGKSLRQVVEENPDEYDRITWFRSSIRVQLAFVEKFNLMGLGGN